MQRLRLKISVASAPSLSLTLTSSAMFVTELHNMAAGLSERMVGRWKSRSSPSLPITRAGILDQWVEEAWLITYHAFKMQRLRGISSERTAFMRVVLWVNGDCQFCR